MNGEGLECTLYKMYVLIKVKTSDEKFVDSRRIHRQPISMWFEPITLMYSGKEVQRRQLKKS